MLPCFVGTALPAAVPDLDVGRGLHLMQDTSPVQSSPVRIVVVFLASAGLALVFACTFAFLACYRGLLFGGLDTFFTVLFTTCSCALVTPVAALVFKRK